MMRAVEYARNVVRRRRQSIPDQYSWLFVMMIETCLVLILIGSTLQRGEADLWVCLASSVLALVQSTLFTFAGVKVLPLLVGLTWWGSCALLLFATSAPVAVDPAPLLLVLMVGCIGSLVRQRWGAVAFVAAASLLIAATATHRLGGLALYLSFVALGWLMGYQVSRQHQLLVRQREMQADLAEHAAADERRRIAREVHDVIAHSLSVTMLHVTGARHALQQDRDIDDAVIGLVDAERLGRQAMADIRRTVDLLEAGPSTLTPVPGLVDIPDLVEDFVSAGLSVTLQTDGRPERVSAAVGLALYRIAQESLANIAKHSAASKTDVCLLISPYSASLSVDSIAPAMVSATPASQTGRGLAGMRQRVELLGGILDAGPCRRGWSVRAEIPFEETKSRRCTR